MRRGQHKHPYSKSETQNITSRPEISLNASAQREVESAIILTLYPISLKYSAIVIPGIHITEIKNEHHNLKSLSLEDVK